MADPVGAALSMIAGAGDGNVSGPSCWLALSVGRQGDANEQFGLDVSGIVAEPVSDNVAVIPEPMLLSAASA